MYQIKQQLKPSKLTNISDEQVNDHWKLYKGYVKQVNILNEELKKLDHSFLIYADRRRRYGFEYNGMVLHEYYFENLSPTNIPSHDSPLIKTITSNWGTFENWQKDFIEAGKTRGIGWAILYADPSTTRLTNHFISEHENGHIAGYTPLLVMDVWEHAYMVDHHANGRAQYIEAFMQNINWKIVESRFNKGEQISLSK